MTKPNDRKPDIVVLLNWTKIDDVAEAKSFHVKLNYNLGWGWVEMSLSWGFDNARGFRISTLYSFYPKTKKIESLPQKLIEGSLTSNIIPTEFVVDIFPYQKYFICYLTT